MSDLRWYRAWARKNGRVTVITVRDATRILAAVRVRSICRDYGYPVRDTLATLRPIRASSLLRPAPRRP